MSHHIEFEQWVGVPLETVFLFFSDPRNLPRIMPRELGTRLMEVRRVAPPPSPSGFASNELAGVGSEIVTSVRVLPPLPLRTTWIALITEFEWNHHFSDIQKKGPCHSFHHRHEFASESRQGREGTQIRDVIDYEVGFGLVGEIAQRVMIGPSMRRAFAHRQRALEQLLKN